MGLKFNVYARSSKCFKIDAKTKQDAVNSILKTCRIGDFEISKINVSSAGFKGFDQHQKCNVYVQANKVLNIEAASKHGAMLFALDNLNPGDLELDELSVSDTIDEFDL